MITRLSLLLLVQLLGGTTATAKCPDTLHSACTCKEELGRITVYCSSAAAEAVLPSMAGLALERLRLVNCTFAASSMDAKIRLASLSVLDIEHCGLTGLADQALDAVASTLEELSLRNNKLNTVPLLRSLPKLVRLDLDSNQLHDLPEGAFDGLPRLRQLSLRGNHICTLTSNALAETKATLELLDLAGNCLSAVPAPALRNSQRLTYLDLSANKIAEIGNFNLMNLPELRELLLVDNLLHRVHPMAFMNVPELRLLHLRNNLIANLDGNRLQAFAKLEILDARNNMLSKLPSFKELPMLKEIRLDGNLITQVETLAFTSNPNLQLISLQDNEISVVARNSFDSLDKLVVLLLSNNAIKSIDRGMLDGMKNLQQLDMRNNSVIEVDKASFAPLKLLTTLDLGHNRIKSIGIGTFDVMNKLFWLDLSGNQLRTIKKGTFSKKVSNIILDGNPLDCNGDLDDFVRYLVVNKVRTFLPAQPEVTCASPEAGKPFKEVMMKMANDTKDIEDKPEANQQLLNSILPSLALGGLGVPMANRGATSGIPGLTGFGDLGALANAVPSLSGLMGGSGSLAAGAAAAPPVRATVSQPAAAAASPAASMPNINLAALSTSELETLIAALPPMSVSVPGYGELDVSKLPPSLVAHVLRGGQIPGVPKEALDQITAKYVSMMRELVGAGMKAQQQQQMQQQQGQLQQGQLQQGQPAQLPTTRIERLPIHAVPPASPAPHHHPTTLPGSTPAAQPAAATAALPTLSLSPQALEMIRLLPAGYNISQIPIEVMSSISRGEMPDLNLLPLDLQGHLMAHSNEMLAIFSRGVKQQSSPSSSSSSIDDILAKLPKWERPDLPTFSPYDINDIHNELVQEEEAQARQATLRLYSAVALACIGALSIFVVGLLCYCNRRGRSAPLHHRPLHESTAAAAAAAIGRTRPGLHAV